MDAQIGRGSRRFFYVGLAVVTLVYSAAVLTVNQWWGVGMPIATLARSFLICACVYAVAAVWSTSSLLFLTMKLSAVSLLILFGFFALGEFTAAELGAMVQFFRRAAPPPGPPPS